ncbi:MAG: aminoacyl-tRNA hydrolase [Oscillospiraceae bacterium]|nr:aminoacyl-tRNA hydrolase [Oscillospiraceae bacterium]
MEFFMFFKKKVSLNASNSGGGINFIICGLGNPGTKYENTRHNCGFMVIDDLATKYSQDKKLKKLKFKSLTGEAVINGTKTLLMKPSTYMNLSGQAVTEAMRFYKLPPSKVLIICDDINLDIGIVRIRESGSDGGQNGLKNIIMLSGADDFPRVRIGVGKKSHPNMQLSDWVLSPFLKSEKEPLEFALANALLAVETIVGGNIIGAMNKINGAKYTI